MWKRKTLKKRARLSLKSNYWRMIAVCFLAAMLTTAYTASTSIINQSTPDQDLETGVKQNTGTVPAANASNSETIADTVKHILDSTQTTSFFPSPAVKAAKQLIDFYTSGKSVLFSTLRTVNSLLDDNFQFASAFLILGALVSLFYQFFISNLILVGEKRFFLETRNYHRTRISKIFFLYKLRYIMNPAWIMFCRSVFQWLWNLTIIGGIIKHYEYSMIPYILAENPAIERKDAFALSKRLMRGNKWKLFLLNLSFFWWQILSAFTLEILNFVFLNPYITSTETELYLELRQNYVKSRSAGYEALNDSMLETVPSEDELLISKALYDDSEGPYTKVAYFAPEQYPAFLFSIQPPGKAVVPVAAADRHYSFLSSILLFFFFSISGWLLESFIHLIRFGIFPDPGLLMGPWIPLYGLCGIIMLLTLKRLSDKPILVFGFTMIIYGVAEYLTNWLLEYIWDRPYRDYTGYYLNLNGRTYLGGAVFFALVGSAFLYYLAPKWDNMLKELSLRTRIFLCVLLCALFAVDIVFAFLSM